MTEAPRRPVRKPSASIVAWSSVALFAVLFALLTYQLSYAAQTTATKQPTLLRKVVKRKVVTTIVPGPGGSSVNAGRAFSSESSPATPITTGAS